VVDDDVKKRHVEGDGGFEEVEDILEAAKANADVEEDDLPFLLGRRVFLEPHVESLELDAAQNIGQFGRDHGRQRIEAAFVKGLLQNSVDNLADSGDLALKGKREVQVAAEGGRRVWACLLDVGLGGRIEGRGAFIQLVLE